MSFPTPWSVRVRPYTSDAKNSHNKPVPQYGAPGSPVPVYGWAPAGSSEPSEPNRSAVTHDLDLYVPVGFTCGPRDQIDILSDTYEVDGLVEDFTHGPFGFMPGGLVRLKKVDG